MLLRLLLATCGVAVLCAETPAYADVGTPVVAVFELEDATKLRRRRSRRRLITSLTDYLRVKLAEGGRVKVVDESTQRAELRKLVRRQKKRSYRACVDASCQVPLGKALAADKILRSKLTRFGDRHVISVEIIDLATEASAGAATAKSDGSPEGMMGAIEAVAVDLIETLVPPPAPEPEPEPAPELAVAPAPPPPPEAQVTMVKPPPTTLDWTLVIGGWSVFVVAYGAGIVGALLTEDVTSTYYSFFPIVGPILVEQLNSSTLQRDSNVLNYVDAGVQALGVGVALIGHILIETKDPVPSDTLDEDGGTITFFVGPRSAGIAGTF